MNTLLHAAAGTIGLRWILGVTTVTFFACFAGWAAWAYASHNKQHMDEAGRLPIVLGD